MIGFKPANVKFGWRKATVNLRLRSSSSEFKTLVCVLVAASESLTSEQQVWTATRARKLRVFVARIWQKQVC
jgi:hypothetical protein